MLPVIKDFYNEILPNEDDCKHIGMFLNVLEKDIEKYNIQQMVLILFFMKTTKVYNDDILDFLLYYVEINFDNLIYQDKLNIINIIFSNRKIVPYELVYKLRNKFNNIHLSLEDKWILKTLKLFSKLKMTYTEIMFENIFKRMIDPKFLENCLDDDYVWILFAYSKIKFREKEFFDIIIDKIITNIKTLEFLRLKIFLISLSELQFDDMNVYINLLDQFNIINIMEDLKIDPEIKAIDRQYFQKICDYLINYKKESDVKLIDSDIIEPEKIENISSI